MDGYIHSTESFGTVDGPGVRFVIFLQGCPMRCKYCHNPDTWKMNTGTTRSAQSLIQDFRRNAAFYKNGGITVTGGEALMQIDFLLELFGLAKKEGIHTCLDTSGITYRPGQSNYNDKLDRLLELTDLDGILAFARYLAAKRIPVWIRHVVVPGITDDPDQLTRLGTFIAGLPNVKALDVLPYHVLGVHKYRELGLSYPLEGVEPATHEHAKAARETILNAIRTARRKA